VPHKEMALEISSNSTERAKKNRCGKYTYI